MRRRSLLVVAAASAAIATAAACGPHRPPAAAAARAAALLPDVRTAKDRPPVALVVREGDPAGAAAFAVTTAGIDADDGDPEVAVALAGVAEARLAARGVDATVTPAWDGYRGVALLPSEPGARAVAAAIHAALAAPIAEADVAAAKKKLAALAQRPLADAALARWARCVGSPYAAPARAGVSGQDLDAARLERWRAAAHGATRVAIGVVAAKGAAEAVAATILGAPPSPRGAPLAPSASVARGRAFDADVYDAPPAPGATSSGLFVHATLDVGSSSAAVAAAEALGDPRGPLAIRLAGLDLPFRLREVTGTAHARGGCVGVVLEAIAPQGARSASANVDAASGEGRAPSDIASRVADAVALVHVEARVHLSEGGALVDGRTLARRAGDAREAAERAAWWALVDRAAAPGAPLRGSVALGMPTKRGAPPSERPADGPDPEALASAIDRAVGAFAKPVVEGRTRVEPGQGEAWVLVASPCGTDGETDADAGLSALVVLAAADLARSSPAARIEPWIAPDGVGLLVHGPALAGETPAARARRLADVAARSFAAEPLPPSALARARAEALRRDVRAETDALSVLASAIAPSRPSSVFVWGRADAIARVSDAAILGRAQALRAGPLRVAVIAGVDAAEAEAAVRAADRWVDRHAATGTPEARACRPSPAAGSPRPGTYALTTRTGGPPEALLAFPLPPGDDAARAAADVVVAALEGGGGLLERALGAGLARAWSARVAGVPRAPALVVRVVSADDKLDAAVMQTRALFDRLREGGLPAPDYARAVGAAERDDLASALDPRARVVATFRGEPVPTAGRPARPRPSAADVRAFADKRLVEDEMVVVAARPARPAPPPASSSSAPSPSARKP